MERQGSLNEDVWADSCSAIDLSKMESPTGFVRPRYVRILVKKYTPAMANSASGDQAANAAGSRLTSPSCSNSLPSDQYAIAMVKLTPTPAMAPRLPARNANGTEIRAITSANSGSANFR